MTIKIIIQGIPQVRRFLKKKNRNVFIQTQVGLKNAALFMQGEVKESIAGRRAEPTSVDTGRFLNSVENTLRKFSAIVFSQVPYARILEFGGRNRAARRHFNNSLARNRLKIRSIISKQLRFI